MRVVLLVLSVLVVVVVVPQENKVKPNCQSISSSWLKLSVGLGLGWVLTKVSRTRCYSLHRDRLKLLDRWFSFK